MTTYIKITIRIVPIAQSDDFEHLPSFEKKTHFLDKYIRMIIIIHLSLLWSNFEFLLLTLETSENMQY